MLDYLHGILHGSSITFSVPLHLISFGSVSLQGHRLPPTGLGLSQSMSLDFVPLPQLVLQEVKFPSSQPPLTKKLRKDNHI